jgi:hypothetical protein
MEFTHPGLVTIKDYGSQEANRMLSIALRHDEHTRKYRVGASQPYGWELTLTEDTKPTRHVHFDDWHRVERALLTVQLEIEKLTEEGWRVV